MELWLRLVAGLCASSAIALFAWRRGSLSRSGALAALAIGTSIYAGGGGVWFLALFTFFVTSTLLAKVGRTRKAQIKLEFEKGDTRDALQACANGGVAALCALGAVLAPHAAWTGAFLGALATANGDTWATELGTLSQREPWSLLGLRRVPRGSSGAVSPLGLGATAAGGLVIGLVVAAGEGGPTRGLGVALLGLVCGVAGSLADSLLGASLQAGYRCPACAVATEGARHACGSRTQLTRGFAWFDNDLVNLAATLFGALLGASGMALLGPGAP
ncbi:MAG TPA: DUF92 domain-containing protein [Polyangiales bacterium]